MIAKIKEKREIAKGMLEVVFDTGGQELIHAPGQFCKVTIVNPHYTDNRGNGRFLGFTSSPSQKNTFSVLTRLGVSGFKKSLAEMPAGSEVDISGIDGRIKLPEDKNLPLVFIAGNIGIAPIMGILRYCNEINWLYTITLVYVNENRESAAFFEELEGFAKLSSNFNMIAVMTNDPQWTGEKSNIDSKFIKDHFLQPEKNLYYVTGIPAFVPAVLREIKTAGIPLINIKMEIFTGY